MMNLNMDFVEEGDKLIAVIKGDIDAYHSADFKRIIREKMAGFSEKKIVLDMSHVSYIDSAGLGSLVALLKDARNQGKSIVLASLKPNVKRIFEMTRLDRVFKISDTLEEA
jgi:anti-sigma B factor antagonist